MNQQRSRFGRRDFLMVGAGILAATSVQAKSAAASRSGHSTALAKINDDLVREGVQAAIEKTLKPAATQLAYPGHFTVTADGSHYGKENTWPGLDSWEMVGAYLLMGEAPLVLDYFDFVHASQRKDGNIPFAIFPADSPPAGMDTFLRGLRYPEDVYTFAPLPREGQPATANMSPRKWIGLFDHWQPIANPLSVLGPLSYVMTAGEIADELNDDDWLRAKLDSISAAARYVLSRKSPNGLLSGAGFYIERPPRSQWDGITQCYAVKAFRLLATMHSRVGQTADSERWTREADTLSETFRSIFWRDNHFAEYVHPEHGVVDHHGLSDVNWAAVAFDVATGEQTQTLWPLMLADEHLWHGDMPTQLVSKPYAYREWELMEPLPWKRKSGELWDVAAMGRVWYLEAMACLQRDAHDRLRESVRQVCEMGKRYDWYWFERYHPLQVWDVYAAGPKGYCEYAAILVRVVLGQPQLFTGSA